MGRKTCAFCGRNDKKISNEHAWPNWVRRLLPDGPMHITSGKPGGEKRQWLAADHMGVTVNCVCKECNEGWMERLERAVRPILEPVIAGHPQAALDRAQQKAVATWAYKTSMVFEFAGYTEMPFYSDEERRLLVETLSVPARKVTVSVASYSGSAFCTAFHHFVGYDVPDHPTVKTLVGHCTTVTLGRFVVQTLSMHFDDDSSSVFQIPIRTVEGGWHQFTVGIWPNPHPTAAWPNKKLDDEMLILFMNRWNVGGRLKGPPVLNSARR